MTPIVIAAVSVLIGMMLGVSFCEATIRRPRKRVRELRELKEDDAPVSILRSVTRLIFVTTQVSALVWVFTSYGIAIYSTVRLEQVYTMAELSEPAIHTILGVGVLKVLENVFEHNNGPVFGYTKEREEKQDAEVHGDEVG